MLSTDEADGADAESEQERRGQAEGTVPSGERRDRSWRRATDDEQTEERSEAACDQGDGGQSVGGATDGMGHGTEDSVVPFEMSRQLYEKAPSPKRLKLILGGEHNNSARVGGAEYLNAVRQFIALVHEQT